MKLIQTAVIAAVALVCSVANAATSYTFTPPGNIIVGIFDAFQGLSTVYSSNYFYRGFILGLQQNQANTAHPCYQSYLSLEADVVDLPNFFNSLATSTSGANSVANALITNVWDRPGTYFTLAKKASEIGGVYFNMYNQCYFDDLLISIGRTINSFAGGFNTLATLIVYGMNTLDFSNTSNDLVIMYSVEQEATPNNDDIQTYGLHLANMVKSIFNISVPDAQLTSA